MNYKVEFMKPVDLGSGETTSTLITDVELEISNDMYIFKKDENIVYTFRRSDVKNCLGVERGDGTITHDFLHNFCGIPFIHAHCIDDCELHIDAQLKKPIENRCKMIYFPSAVGSFCFGKYNINVEFKTFSADSMVELYKYIQQHTKDNDTFGLIHSITTRQALISKAQTITIYHMRAAFLKDDRFISKENNKDPNTISIQIPTSVWESPNIPADCQVLIKNAFKSVLKPLLESEISKDDIKNIQAYVEYFLEKRKKSQTKFTLDFEDEYETKIITLKYPKSWKEDIEKHHDLNLPSMRSSQFAGKPIEITPSLFF